MVEKSGATGGILKKVARSLDSVPENGEPPMLQRRDTGDDIPAEKNQTAHEEETSKFKTLCEGVQNQLALFQVSMVELLALKDELLQHALPPSLLVKVALVTSKLFRGASDLAIPVNELVRLVKLYSAPWESKSAALKKLHDDYENKQRQLNVALQKLVLVGIQSERMAQERRVLNWERLFTRMMTSKAHGYRWKFLIESFKKKMKSGEIYEVGASTDEDTEKVKAKNDRQLESIRRRSMSKETAAKRIMKESVTIESAKNSFSTPSQEIQVKEVTSEEEVISDIDVSVKDEEQFTFRQKNGAEHPLRKGKISPQQLSPSKPAGKPKISFSFKPPSDDEDESGDETDTSPAKPGLFQFKPTRQPAAAKRPGRGGVKFAEEKPKAKAKPQSRGVKFFDPSDDEEDEEKPQQKQPDPTPVVPKVVQEDKECWTNEPDCERFLHFRLYRPMCRKAEAPCCTVVFMGQALKTSTYDPPPPTPPISPEIPNGQPESIPSAKVKTKKGIATVRTSSSGQRKPDVQIDPEGPSPTATSISQEEPLRFEELIFKLPDNNGYAPGGKPVDLSDEQLKVAVHPSRDQPMVAMAALRYGDLKILDQFEGRWSHTDSTNEAQTFPLMSTLSDRDMPFGSECGHVPVVCYMSKVESPKTMTKETETESFEQLIRNEIAERRKAEEQERSAAMIGVSPPQYTESEMQSIRDSHAEEVQSLHEEYERRLNEFAQGLDSYSGNEEGMREFVHAATSPLLIRSPSPARSASQLRSSSPLLSQSAQSPMQSQATLAEQQRVPRPPTEGRSTSSRKSKPKIPNLPAWGKDLPQDFLVRLDMFNENSEKYRLELEDKTKRAIQQKYELQMAVQNRLSIPDDEQAPQEEVCLPAVFMPTKTGLVFTPKAHSYFHPPGSSEGRLTQPPSMFKLPHLNSPNQVAVLNLFEMGQQFKSNHGQAHKTSTGAVPQTAPPPPPVCDMESSRVYPGRACTR